MINQAPAFFSDAPSIIMHDELAQFLGSSETGLFKYHYSDVVLLAGHSCPTVAAAYLATCMALKKLYPDTIPERGWLSVQWRDDKEDGVTGVMANVVGFITGAADEGGFKGLTNRFNRKDLMLFNQAIDSEFVITRRDTKASAAVNINLDSVPPHPDVRQLAPLCVMGKATEGQQKQFAAAWQSRVKALLLEHADDEQVFQVTVTG